MTFTNAFIVPLPCVPQRYLTVIEGFITLTVNFMMRFCISIALPAMIKPSTKVVDTTCNFTEAGGTSTENKTYPFDWSHKELSFLQSSFFVGYTFGMIPSGMLSDAIGPKIPTISCLSLTGLLTILHPPLGHLFGVWGMIIPRLLVGLCQTLSYTSLHTLVALWIPQKQRAFWGALVFSGVYVGNVVNFTLSGFLIKYVDDGWEIVFYAYGSLGILMAIIFYFTIYNRPEENPNIKPDERALLDEYMKAVISKADVKKVTPWKAILTNNPVWSVVIASAGHDWGFFLILTSMPTFLKAVLHYDIASNGMIMSMMSILVFVLAITSGYVVDFVAKRKYVSLTWNRKIGTTVASVIPSLGMLLGGYTNCGRTLTMIFLTAGYAFMGVYYPSLKVNPIDLSPNFAGTIGALVTAFGGIAGFSVSFATTWMTPDNTLAQWRTVFWLGFGIMTITNIYYLLFASAELQAFNNVNEEGKK